MVRSREDANKDLVDNLKVEVSKTEMIPSQKEADYLTNSCLHFSF